MVLRASERLCCGHHARGGRCRCRRGCCGRGPVLVLAVQVALQVVAVVVVVVVLVVVAQQGGHRPAGLGKKLGVAVAAARAAAGPVVHRRVHATATAAYAVRGGKQRGDALLSRNLFLT